MNTFEDFKKILCEFYINFLKVSAEKIFGKCPNSERIYFTETFEKCFTNFEKFI